MRRMRELFTWQGAVVILSVGLIAWGSTLIFKRGKMDRKDWAPATKVEEQASKPKSKAKKEKALVAEVNNEVANYAEEAAAEVGSSKFAKVTEINGIAGVSGMPLEGEEYCASSEYRGDSLARVEVSKKDWAKFKEVYHGVKRDLASWLNKNKDYFNETAYKTMEKQVKELVVQKAPSSESPDLAWRGIGVYTEDQNHHPVVRIGGGFMELMKKYPKRARFELARLLAQSWSPCEVKKLAGTAGEGVWDPLLQCMEVLEYMPCSDNSFSEGGWAVSSVVANQIAHPKCKLPAFKEERATGCLKTLGRELASTKPKVAPAAVAPVEKPEVKPSAKPEIKHEGKPNGHKEEKHS